MYTLGSNKRILGSYMQVHCIVYIMIQLAQSKFTMSNEFAVGNKSVEQHCHKQVAQLMSYRYKLACNKFSDPPISYWDHDVSNYRCSFSLTTQLLIPKFMLHLQSTSVSFSTCLVWIVDVLVCYYPDIIYLHVQYMLCTVTVCNFVQ